jgi:hypothetical protein
MISAAAALALAVTLLLLEAPGGALAQGAGAGRAGENVLKRSKPTPADLDRSILLECRASSPQLHKLWSDENAPVSEWDGVTVGGDGRVVKVELQSRGWTGPVPAALGGLTAMETLDLHMNSLTSVPKELGGLTALKTLNLDWNMLASVPPELGNLAALETLDLSSNNLESVPPALGWAVQGDSSIKTRVETAYGFSA